MFNTAYINKTVKQLKKMGDDFNQQGFQVPAKVNQIFFEQGNHMRNAIITLMKNTPRESYFYKATKSGKKHYPSKAGNPPAVNTAELARSYNLKVGNMKMEVGSTAKHAEPLEEGTKNMGARPVLTPVTDNYEPIIDRELAALNIQLVKKAAGQ